MDDLNDLINNARDLYQAGNLGDSESVFRRVAALNTPVMNALGGLGMIRLRQGNLDGAVALFTTVMEIMEDADACYGLGLVAEKRGAFSDALRHYQNALRINPNHAGAKKQAVFVQSKESKVSTIYPSPEKPRSNSPGEENLLDESLRATIREKVANQEYAVGVAHNVQRVPESKKSIWSNFAEQGWLLSFRIHLIDENGIPRQSAPVQVQMSGRKFEGEVQNGDFVYARRQKGGLISTNVVGNITTGVTVRSKW